MKNLKKINDKKDCNLFEFANKLQEPIFDKSSESTLNITGLACSSNVTLKFIAMDSLIYHHFAERLSVNLEKNNTAVILVNEKMESHHVLTDISSSSLKEFIYNFTVNQLQRAFYSSSMDFRNTHVYAKVNCFNERNESICLRELDSQNYLPTVLQLNKVC